MTIDDEARVIDPGVEAHLVPDAGRRQAGEKRFHVGLVHLAHLVGTNGAGNGLGRGRDVVLLGRELDALLQATGGGKAVDRLRRRQLPDVDREALGRKQRVGGLAAGAEPVEDLAGHHELAGEVGLEHAGKPGAGRHDQLAAAIDLLVRLHRDRAAVLGERDDLLVEPQLGAERSGGLQLGLNASLRTHEAAHGVMVGRIAVDNIEGGEALPERRAVEKLVVHLGGLCRGHGGIEEPGDAVVGRALAGAGNR